MLPKRLYSHSEKVKVKTLLAEFYSNKPVEYGRYDHRAGEYQRYAELISEFAPLKGKHLELGCGDWQIPQAIANLGFEEVIGCDFFSDEYLSEYQKKLTAKNAQLVRYDGQKIPYPDNYFDTVSSLCVMEHIVDVEEMLTQMHRVLKPKGILIVKCPNWSGINNPIRAMQYLLTRRTARYWQYESFIDAFFGVFRSIGWYLEALLSSKPKWIMVYPLMKDGKIYFQSGDDDVVHLCQPISFKKYFEQKGYKLILFNRGKGESRFARLFNSLFPAFATTINIIAQKPG
jgi:ubiquinone/menaquinone biosynthesis C-methylase UbiE